MLACKHCSTPNSLDSTFCKKCGTAVPADQKREATAQLDKLVDEGLAALNAGRTAEALAIADSAVATDPTHLGALHLKSAVHERRGEIADALESAERIVELNPDSELDRIKRNGLRSALLNASTPVTPDRRIAFVAAAAAMVLVACAGILIARKPAETTPQNQVASNTPVADPIVGPPVEATPHPATDVAPNNINPAPQPQNEPVTRPLPQTDFGDGQLPIAEGNGQGTTLRPIDPGTAPNPEKTTPETTTKPPVNKDPGGDPAPTALPPQVEAKSDTGQIDIQISSGSGKKTGGSQTIPETRTNGAAAYAQVGTERFQLGDFAGAAANLEKAVSNGGNPVSLNLMLAQAYGRLGRKSEAAAAYERSSSAATQALQSGKGDRERLQAQRDAADAGLRTVRGG